MKTLVSAMVLAIVLATAVGCERVNKLQPIETEPATVADGSAKAEDADEGTVPQSASSISAATVKIGNACFDPIEIATTDEELERGINGRESVAENGGMLFVFDRMGDEKFWTKDMLFPLDIIFIDEQTSVEGVAKPNKVVYIIEGAPAGSTELLESAAPFRYVLEVPAGSVERKGIKIGDAVEKAVGGCK